jgi:hypothetical protein
LSIDHPAAPAYVTVAGSDIRQTGEARGDLDNETVSLLCPPIAGGPAIDERHCPPKTDKE